MMFSLCQTEHTCSCAPTILDIYPWPFIDPMREVSLAPISPLCSLCYNFLIYWCLTVAIHIQIHQSLWSVCAHASLCGAICITRRWPSTCAENITLLKTSLIKHTRSIMWQPSEFKQHFFFFWSPSLDHLKLARLKCFIGQLICSNPCPVIHDITTAGQGVQA